MEKIDARLVFARRQRRRFKNEAVPVIRSASRLTNVWPMFSGRTLFDELIVDEELYFHPPARGVIVNCPSGYSLRVCVIQPTAQAWVRRREIEACRHRRDQQRFGDGLADEQISQARA
jgi:hypothetical protein